MLRKLYSFMKQQRTVGFMLVIMSVVIVCVTFISVFAMHDTAHTISQWRDSVVDHRALVLLWHTVLAIAIVLSWHFKIKRLQQRHAYTHTMLQRIRWLGFAAIGVVIILDLLFVGVVL